MIWKVLIADDEILEIRYLSNLFARHKDRFSLVGEAKNGAEVLALSTQLKPDIIIMDIHMPMMNGLDSAHKIKKQFPDTLIILNTAYAEFEFARKALEDHLDAYLLKPAREEQILEAIEKGLNARQSLKQECPSDYAQSLSESASTQAKDAISSVTGYIDKCYYLPLTLQDLADFAHFSPTYLSRLFHQTQGVTIKEYITQKRLDHARFLLQTTEMPIQEIAQSSGFSNISHFNRIFKQQNNLPPQEFRNR